MSTAHQIASRLLPHHQAWLAGDITALESLAIDRRHLIAEHADAMRGAGKIMQAHHRRQRVRAYLELRSIRKERAA